MITISWLLRDYLGMYEGENSSSVPCCMNWFTYILTFFSIMWIISGTTSFDIVSIFALISALAKLFNVDQLNKLSNLVLIFPGVKLTCTDVSSPYSPFPFLYFLPIPFHDNFELSVKKSSITLLYWTFKDLLPIFKQNYIFSIQSNHCLGG